MLLDVGDHVIVSGGTQIHFPFPFFSLAVKSVPMPLPFQTVSELATHINITKDKFSKSSQHLKNGPERQQKSLFIQFR